MRWTVCIAAGLTLWVCGCTSSESERLRDYNQDGVQLFRKGDYAHAGECFQAALALKPNDPGLLFDLGECYAHQNDLDKAQQYYTACLQRSPNHLSCQHAQLCLLVRQGRSAEAARQIEDWMAREPKQAAPYAEDGWLLHQAGDLPRAQARLQQALELDPHNVRALTELALVYEAMHRPDRAVVLYERALAQDRNQPDVTDRINQLKAQGAGRPQPE